MDFEYSPHRSAGGTMHLLSPTHHSQYTDVFPSIKQIRRSLSRSPSKPSRYQIHGMNSPKHTVTSPRLPSVFSRHSSSEAGSDNGGKTKFTLRKTTTMKATPRKTSPDSPMRRALSDVVSQNNATNISLPFRSSAIGQENTKSAPPDASNMRFELDSEPIKFDLLKAHADKPRAVNAAMREHLTPAKSSPLKRSDGIMNLDQPNFGSPRAKRRSLHGAAFGSDFNIFEQGFDGSNDFADGDKSQIFDGPSTISSPRPQRSPQRKAFSLRRSTLQQRAGHKPSSAFDTTEAPLSPAPAKPIRPTVSRSDSTMSLDNVVPSTATEQMTIFPPPLPLQRTSQIPRPHPLSKTLTTSSSSSSIPDEPMVQAPTPRQDAPRPYAGFSKSLPIGALRPRLDTSAGSSQHSSSDSFETPEAYKMARPLPAAFMSTGLISKRNREVDIAPANFGSSLNMPDTPSKRMSMPNMAVTPGHGSPWASLSHARHEFGSPTTPFSPHVFKGSPESFGKGVSIFGSRVAGGKLIRRSSFLSVDGDDNADSPTAKMDSQVSADDLPPTPTKPANCGPRPQSKGKGNSLRSSLLGRRSSLAPDTFHAPDGTSAEQQLSDGKYSFATSTPRRSRQEDMIAESRTPFITFTPSDDHISPSIGRSRLSRHNTSRTRSPSPLSQRSIKPIIIIPPTQLNTEVMMQAVSTPSHNRESLMDVPLTPMESYTPPDASRLSISGEQNGYNGRLSFNGSGNSFPPATPTGPRDQPFNFSISQGNGSSSMFQNDVDTALTSRFGGVQIYGNGEFSIVYRVENPVAGGPAKLNTSRSASNVWAVKKTKKPYAGSKDRARKMKEVQILKALKGQEHVIETVDTWEMKNYLYIQTEFCENGNLKDFLSQAGYKARLDDFRIWKVLLELSQGVKCIHDAGFIHLDLKPANVFIDWEGVLKIGDFGMASSWPAPPHIDGEGDREYIAPEALSGRFDKPADVFSLGMIMLEIAGNIVLPDNGTHWQRLRSGDLSDLPGLTFSSDSSLVRDESGDPVGMLNDSNDTLHQSAIVDDGADDDLGFCSPRPNNTPRARDLVQPPSFMTNPEDFDSLDKILQALLCPDPDGRPVMDQVLACGSVQWVAARRRAGATIYEGNFGPADDVFSTAQDVDMLDT